MVTIKQVSNKKEMKEFVKFPLRLYKGVDEFVPPLFADELKLFGKSNPYNDIAETVFFLAYQDNKIVGRISGIIQHQYNEKHNEKRARFTRFDSINDFEVAKALFDAVIDWAKQKEMDTICGPLDYNDLGREGLLIEGFDQLSTFEEQYNYPYYMDLIEQMGFVKDVDWLEFKLSYPGKDNDTLAKVSKKILDMNKLHIVDSSKYSKKAYINKYRHSFFYCLDECYKHLYGTVPIDEESQKSLVKQFMQIINKKYLIFIADENEKVVAFALSFPSISRPFQKSGGRLTIPALFRLLKAVRHPSVIDLGLIGVLPEYQAKGINAAILQIMMDCLKAIDHAETNLNLETNHQVMNQWRYFSHVNHKRRRSYVREIK